MITVHEEAYVGFGWALFASGLSREEPYTVLDLGGQDVNGTAHDWFPKARITTLDLVNADIIADATCWHPDRHFDVVTATEVFEHVEDWRGVIKTAWYALDPLGPGVFIATCASDNRPPHGMSGAPLPEEDEHYQNVEPWELEHVLKRWFTSSQVRYQYPPGDAYMWARRS